MVLEPLHAYPFLFTSFSMYTDRANRSYAKFINKMPIITAASTAKIVGRDAGAALRLAIAFALSNASW